MIHKDTRLRSWHMRGFILHLRLVWNYRRQRFRDSLVLVLLSVSGVRREGITTRRSIKLEDTEVVRHAVVCITYKCGRHGALFITELDGDDVLCRIEEEDNGEGESRTFAPAAPSARP